MLEGQLEGSFHRARPGAFDVLSLAVEADVGCGGRAGGHRCLREASALLARGGVVQHHRGGRAVLAASVLNDAPDVVVRGGTGTRDLAFAARCHDNAPAALAGLVEVESTRQLHVVEAVPASVESLGLHLVKRHGFVVAEVELAAILALAKACPPGLPHREPSVLTATVENLRPRL